MSDVKFVSGLRVFAPNAKAPEFIKGNLKINKAELMSWLIDQKDVINCDIKASKKGSWYISVNEYEKPKDDKAPQNKQPENTNQDDLPF